MKRPVFVPSVWAAIMLPPLLFAAVCTIHVSGLPPAEEQLLRHLELQDQLRRLENDRLIERAEREEQRRWRRAIPTPIKVPR